MKDVTPDWQKEKKPYLRQISRLSFESRQWNRKQILEMRDFLSPWNHNVKLRNGIFTASCDTYYPTHQEIMKVIHQQLRGDYRNKRIMDLGCLEGYFSAECALQGATVLGIDGKIINVKKCEFIRSVLDIPSLTFIKDDAMKVTKQKYGSFDVVLALGLLYHFDNPFRFLENMSKLCDGFMVIDTLVAVTDEDGSFRGWKPDLSSMKEFKFGRKTYSGRLYREFGSKATQLFKDLSYTASLKNEFSVWLTEDSLVGLLRDVGFEEISKIVFPKNANLWWAEDSRVLLVANKKRKPLKSKIFLGRS